uniref:Uncharacterized protein LOC113793258 n=1 Tax=Dermatophagoides pteronyssinus TaxID=6956 RepID=A0A6P6Y0J1_DERPT|nr:uncharacterized protein LOC113793258 [Dermatophagoides pteronyssinus]
MKSLRRFREKSMIVTPFLIRKRKIRYEESMIMTTPTTVEKNSQDFSPTSFTNCSSSSSSLSPSSPGLQNFRTMIDCIEQIEQDNHHYNQRIKHRLDLIKRQLRQHRKSYFDQQKSYRDQIKTDKLLTEILLDLRNNNASIEMIKQDLNMIKRQQQQQQQMTNDDRYPNEAKEILHVIQSTSSMTESGQKQISFPLIMSSNVGNSDDCQIELPRKINDNDDNQQDYRNVTDDLVTTPLNSSRFMSHSILSPSSSSICMDIPSNDDDEMKSIQQKLQRLRETVKNPRIKRMILEGQQLITNDGSYIINNIQRTPIENEAIGWVLHPMMTMMCE